MSSIKLNLILIAFALSFGFTRYQKNNATNMFSFWVKPKVETTTLNNSDSTNDIESENSETNNKIQVALLLDTSGSMEGLIEQAKSQLWQILNKLALTEKDGEDPTLEIALYEYGNPSKTNDINQINKLVSFTEDMDLISQKLFELTTSGGEEYCGTVIQSSLQELEWSANPDNLKLIYIAGNESYEQGDINFSLASHIAKTKDISINTIFCGPHNTGINLKWEEGARFGNGTYMSINQNQKTVHIQSPYDDKITVLNKKLNDTYIPFGAKGNSKIQNQKSQDFNASTYGKSNMASRAIFKSSKKYKAESWDLVDAYNKDKKIIHKAESLPDSIAILSQEELELRIQEMAKERELIQEEIKEVGKKRAEYIKSKTIKRSKENNLEDSILESIEKQAKEKNYKLKKN
jgi:hypothetical protein